MKKTVIALAIAVAAALPADAAAAQLRGIVVSKQKAGHVLVVAAPNGTAWTVHTTATAGVGSVVAVGAKQRADGTFLASRLQAFGRAWHARVRAVVSKHVAGMTFLSAGRSVIAVRSKRRSLMSAAGLGPAPGTIATVGLSIGQGGSLTATSMTPTGKSNEIVIQASVASITPATATTPGSITLTVGGQSLAIPLPAGTALSPSVIAGSTLMLTIRLQPTGPVASPDEDEDDDDQDEAEDEEDDDQVEGDDDEVEEDDD
jgi:hypothetical protein